jgi:hypothetical protein
VTWPASGCLHSAGEEEEGHTGSGVGLAGPRATFHPGLVWSPAAFFYFLFSLLFSFSVLLPKYLFETDFAQI